MQSALFKFTEEFNPDVKIFGGDLLIFSTDENADPADKRESMEADVEAECNSLKHGSPITFC